MEPKDPYSSRQSQGQGQPQSQSLGAAAAPRKKPIPPEQTFAESFYFVKQMQARTPVAVILTDGEVLRGILEWYDRDCIKLTRIGSPNLLIYKHAIKYLYKDGEEAALGGATG
jgi:host factor-I protein